MPGDRDRERNSRDDRDRNRGRYEREGEYSSHKRRRRSTIRERSPRIKRENGSPTRNRSVSPYSKRRQRDREQPRRPNQSPGVKRSPSPEAWGSHQHDLARNRADPPPPPPIVKQKPNYGLSGLLAAASNTKNGIVMKYNEPPEGRQTKGWRIYVYKDGKEIDVLNLDGQSSFLIGRDRVVHALPLFILYSYVGCRYPCRPYFMF